MIFCVLMWCREDQDRVAQKWMEEQTKYEEAHLGNFRRIYPSEGSEKYDKFFHSSGSLYQETASFKARSECARSAPVPGEYTAVLSVLSVFTARRSCACAVLGVVILSVCPSVCLSVRLSYACM